jgi:type VI secretion system protein ImpH
LRPKLSLAFPSADIDRIETTSEQDATGFRITANFLGLYGTASPLPTFYTEDLLAEASQDETVSRDFMDILNQRIYTLFFQGWLKYRQYLQVSEIRDPRHLERLYCLAGLGSEVLRRVQDRDYPGFALLRYLGLLTQYPRSAAGLATLLSDALGGIPLRVVPCIPRKAKIPEAQCMRIGLSGNRIGVDGYLGEEIDDRMGQFRIEIGPLDQAGFLRFTPGKEGYNIVAALTATYVTDPLSYEVELILAARQARTVALGDPVRSVLGVTTWVFSEQYLGEVRTRFAVNGR